MRRTRVRSRAAPGTPRHREQEAAARAARAAGMVPDPGPRIDWHFAGWVATRLLAMGLLLGCAWLVYDSASTSRFQVRTVRITGNSLLSGPDVEQIVSVAGANLFWVDRRDLENRLKRLPVVQRAEVTPLLPDTVEVHVVERQPAAYWVTQGGSYVVDREGIVLKQVCEGPSCSTTLPDDGFPRVVQVDAETPLAAGTRVDAAALATSEHLAGVLPGVGLHPLAFEWTRAGGLEVPMDSGVRVRFDTDGPTASGSDVERQILELQTLQAQLPPASAKQRLALVDLRFGDRPYVRYTDAKP